jgi:hypothetical protein
VRRIVIGIVDRGLEHDVGQLVGDHGGDPRIVDLGGRDQREQRPDVGMGLAADVLASARTEAS